jgi:uncharacterized protein
MSEALRCPMCERAVAKDGDAFPFCSRRCRLLDLDKWFSGSYVVSRPMDARDVEELEATLDGRPPGRGVAHDADEDDGVESDA